MTEQAPLSFTPAVGDTPLTAKQRRLLTLAHELGRDKFAGRAALWDREGSFPFANYDDLREAGLLRLCVPEADGGLGADYATYMFVAAELGRFCGTTALTYNMHICSTMWTGVLADGIPMSDEERSEHLRRRQIHFERVVKDGAVYAQPFSEGSAAAAGRAPFGTTARKVEGGWRINGRKIFASLAGAANYYGVLCTEDKGDDKPDARDTLYMAVPADAPGVAVSGDWDVLGMRGTVSRTLTFQDVFVSDDEQLMPRGVYFKGAQTWPAMFFTIAATYMGLAAGAYDFTVQYLRGEVPGEPPVKRRQFPTKQMAVAQMRIQLEIHARPVPARGAGGQAQPEQGRKAAPVRRALQRDGRRQRHRAPGHPHLRRHQHDETPAAGAPVPRQPLRRPDAALDGRAHHRPHGPRDAVRSRRAGRVIGPIMTG
jgi:alkylation response protein AidB-like acyl-CoA dehydrogenase